jgi:putative endonuclease
MQSRFSADSVTAPTYVNRHRFARESSRTLHHGSRGSRQALSHAKRATDMTAARLRLGKVGEQLACEHLSALGLSIVARNCRTRFGEIDVVVLDRDTLAFVEVKTLRAGAVRGPEAPALAVGPRKQAQVRRLARSWLAENRPPPHRSLRFDVVGVSLPADGGPAEVDYLPNAF